MRQRNSRVWIPAVLGLACTAACAQLLGIEEVTVAADVTISRETADFGTARVRTTGTELAFEIANVGTRPVASLSLSIGDTADFAIVGTTCGAELAAGQRCSLTIGFQPREVGERVGTLRASTEASGIAESSLVGRGAALVTIERDGDGEGTVHSAGGEIDCPGTCSALIAAPLALEPIDDGESFFIEWSGACTGSAPCSIPAADGAEVTARFVAPREIAIAVETPTDIAADGDGNVYVTGSVRGSNGTDGWIRRIDAGLTPGWLSVYAPATGAYDEAAAIAVGPDGNVLVAGTRTPASDEIYEVWVAKLRATDGGELWSRTVGGPSSADGAFDVAADPSGFAVVAGHNLGNAYFGKWHGSTGSASWAANDAAGMAVAVAAGPAGEVLVIGSFDGGNLHAYDAAGTFLWQAQVDATLEAVAVTADGHVWIAGAVDGDAFVQRRDAAGDVSSTARFRIDETAQVARVASIALRPGGVVVAGRGQAGSGTASHAFLAAVNDDGAVPWTRIRATGTSLSAGVGVAIDSAGGVVLVGHDSAEGSFVRRYAQPR